MKNNKRGFTLVELLATITIIGILAVVSIVAVTKLIDRSKKEQREHQKEILALAAEGYMQANRGQLPKSIGETTTITANTLKNNKFLTEDIKDANNKSCMAKSYVIVYKVSKTKYKYQTHLYCGNETVPDSEIKAKPTIAILFLDKEGHTLANDASILNKVREASFEVTITGGKKNSTELELDSYSYTILAGATGNMREVYSSGTLTANRKKRVVVDGGMLADYVDVTGQTTVNIKVTARNVTGGVNDVTITLGGGYEEGDSGTTYKDKHAPVCGIQDPQVTAWINKSSSVKERKIIVPCTDKGESGCVRDTFTKTWPNDGEKAAETGTITIKDNAGNSTSCTVDVKLDLESPVISIDAYKRKENGEKEGSSILNGATKTTQGTTNDTVQITASQYNNLVGVYMNKEKYPYGVVYEVTLTDNLSLSSLTWKTNAKNLKADSSNFTSVGSNNDDAYSNTTSCSNKKSCTLLVGFLKEGQRYGELVATDKAGNTATYKIYANVDRTPPAVPTVTYKLEGTNTNYTQGTWATKKVQSYLTNGNTDAISGWQHYQYSYKKQNGGTSASPTWAAATTGNIAATTGYKVADEGTHKLQYRSCDKAGNCSAYSTEHTIKIDTIKPTCTVTKTHLTNETPNAAGWYKKIVGATSTTIQNGAKVSRACSGETGAYASGCDNTKNGSYDYTTNINTTTAGSSGNNAGGKVYDKAGNATDCSANQTVKIDKNEPTCGTAVGATSTWTNQNITVKLSCTDTGGSGCVKDVYDEPITTEGTTRSTYIMDKADNGATCPYNVYIDQTKPNNFAISVDATETSSGTYTRSSFKSMTFTCSDPVHNGVTSGLKSIKVYEGSSLIDSSTTTSLKITSTPSTGSHTYRQVCEDNAGNSDSKDYDITFKGNETYGCGSNGNGIHYESICSPMIIADGHTNFDTEQGMALQFPLAHNDKYNFDYHCSIEGDDFISIYIKVSKFNCEAKMLYGCRNTSSSNVKTGLTESTAASWLGEVLDNYYPANGDAFLDSGKIAKTRNIDKGWTSYNCKYDTSKPHNLSCTENSDGAYKYSMEKSGSTYTLVKTTCSTWNNLYRLAQSLGKLDQYVRCSWNSSYGKNPCGSPGDI